MLRTFAIVQTCAGIVAGVAPASPAARIGLSAMMPNGRRENSFFCSSNEASLMSLRSLSPMRRGS
eukprot:7288723-Prymnesium_polylepis.1